MKTYNGNQKQERRKKRVFIPIVYLLLEVVLLWLILSIVNVSFDITLWSNISYIVIAIASLYFIYKTYKIYDRQRYLRAI